MGDLTQSRNVQLPAMLSSQQSTAGISEKMDLTSDRTGRDLDTDAPPCALNEIGRTAEPVLFGTGSFDLEVDVQRVPVSLPKPLATPLPGEPAWVGEYDQELINMLRGTVEFVD